MALDTQLISYYRFENGALVADSSGSNPLTNNNTVAGSASGKLGYCADFGSANTTKYLSNASQLGLTVNAARSIAMWVNVTTAPTSGNVASMLTMSYTSNAVGYTLDYMNVSGTMQLRIGRFRDTIDDPPMIYVTTLTTGTWYHVAYTFDGAGNEILYLNGVQVATYANGTGNGTGGSLPNAFNIGRSTAFSRYFSGLTDETGIWARVLSSTEIAQLYNGGAGNNPVLLTTAIVAYYKLDEASGDAADSSGNGNTMTNNGSLTYAAAKINNGANFGSSNTTKYLARGDSLGFVTNNSITITVSAWINFSSPFGNGDITNIFTLNSLNGINLLFNVRGASGGATGVDMEVYCLGATGNNNLFSQTFNTGTWYHLVWVITNGVYTYYINGSQVASAAMTFPSATSGSAKSGIGAPHIAGFALSGFADEVGVWQRALASTEVASLYNSGAGFQYPFSTGLPPARIIRVSQAVNRASTY